MPENDVLFTVDIDGKRFKLNQEQYESTKDTLYKNHPNAQVVRTGLYDAQSGDVQADAGIKVTFDNGMTADITGQQFNETKEQLYKTNPAARVEYTTNESNNYWRSRLDEDKRALQTFDEDNNAFMDEYREALRNSTQMQRGARELTPAQKFVAEHHDEYESKREMRNALGKAIIDNPLVKSGRQAASEDAKRKREEYLQNAENAETGAERRDWKRAAKLMGDAAKMYDAPSQFEENGFSDYLKNYWAGAENTFSDKDFWTRGLTQITRDIDLYGIRKRVQDAQDAKGGELTSEDYDRILSKSEKAQLMAAYNLAYSQANDEIGRAADLPSSFRAGKSAAESLGFMAEFMLGTGIMNVGGKALLKGSKSAFGKWMGEALMSTNARNAAVKEGLLPSVERSTAQEIGRSFAQSLVQGAAHTVAQPLGTLSSVTRELNETDDEGRLNSIGEAVLRGVGDTIIENWSESFGNTIDLGFGVIGNGLGKAMPKTLKTDFGKMARWAYNSQFKKVLAEAGFNGFIGEMAEEWFGNAARVATGLMSTEQFKEFASLDQQLEMAAAFGPMSLIGLAGNLRASAASRKRYNDLAGQVKDILIENGVEQSEVDALFNKKWATNEDIAQSLSPYAKTILQGTGNTEKNYDTFLRFAEAAGAQALQDEVQAAQDENSRNALRDEISAKTGQFWRTDDSPEAKDAEGNPLQINHVRVVEGSDGARRYILSEGEDGTLAYVDENGNKGFTKAGDIERGLEDGSIVSDRDMMLDEYLQERVDAIKTGEERQRMQTEEQENLAAIQQRIQQNPTFEYGSEESPATATFEAPAEQGGLQGGMMLIRKADGTETREFWDWEQIGTALNMPLRAKTDEQIAEDEAKAQEEAEARKNQYNTIKPGAQVMIDNSAAGMEDSPAYFAKAIYDPSENFVRIYVMGEDGKIATNENGNEIFYPEDMVKGLDVAMQSAQSEAQTEAAEVEEEPQAAPVEKYMKEDGSVNETLFLRDEPAEWAKWNDEQNKDGGAGTRRIINAGIQSLDKQIADAQKKLDAEANPDESRRKADALAKLTDRRNTLASIIAGYRQQEAEIAENDMPSDMLTEVPTDANGNKLYTQAPAQLTYEDIYSDENLESEEEAYDFIKGRVNAAKKDLDKVMADADKIKPENYPSTAAYGEAKRAAREAVAPYQTTYDYWKGVQDLADAEVAAQQQRAANAEAKRQDALNTPQTLNELVADIFAGLRNSLNKESFKKETGYSDKDLRPFFQLFAKKGQGMGVERLAEYIAENVQPEQAHLIPTDSNGQKDISAVRDAILEVFQSVASPTDLYNYVRNSNLNREAEEQRRMEEEARQAEEQAAVEQQAEKATFEEQPSEEEATFAGQPSTEEATMEGQPEVDMPDDIFNDGLTDAQVSALSFAMGKTPAQVRAEARAGVIQSYIDSIASEGDGATVATRDNILDIMREYGCSENAINQVKAQLGSGERIRGFRTRGHIFMLSNDITTPEDARSTYVHERQHGMTRREGIAPQVQAMFGDNRKEMLRYTLMMSGADYSAFNNAALADEIVSMAMEVAYTVPEEELESTLREGGIDNEEFINFVKTIDHEQRQSDDLSNARRRPAHASGGTEGSIRQDGRDSQEVSGGNLDISGARPAEDGQGGTGEGQGTVYSRRAREDRSTSLRISDDAFAVKDGTVAFSKNGSLVGMHNISERKLLKALQTGGLANPSAAIIDINKGEHTNFGEISLMMPSSLVDSETGRNAGTYLGDVWSPMYPSVTKQMTDEGFDKLWKDIDKMPRDIGLDAKNAFDNYLERDNIGDALRWWYLFDTNRKPEVVTYNSGLSEEDKALVNQVQAATTKELLENKELFDNAVDMFRRIEDEGKVAWATEKWEERENAAEFYKKRLKEHNDNIDEYGIDVQRLVSFFDDLASTVRRDDQYNQYATTDAARKAVEDGGLEEDFIKWLGKKEREYGAKEKLFVGYTADGYRKYVDNTVENASRLMNREAQRNSNNSGGVGATKSLLIQRVETLDEIRKHRAQLLNKEDYDNNEAYNNAEEAWYNVMERLSNMQKIDDNPFINIDIAEARLQEAIVERNPISYLNREYGYNIPAKGEYADALKAAIKQIKEVPTKFFETKFERPVHLNEFAAAVVPSNISDEARQALTDAGLPIFEYTDNDAQSRQDATMQAAETDGVMFSKINSTFTQNNEDNDRTRITPTADARGDNGRNLPGQESRKMEITADRGRIRLLEQRVAPEHFEYSGSLEGHQQRLSDQGQEAQRLIAAAKENGLFIEPGSYDALPREPRSTRESTVYYDAENNCVIKVKDPFAIESMSRNTPFEELYLPIIHNIYFPESRYTFLGITTNKIGDEVRFVLQQDYILSPERVYDAEAVEFIKKHGFKPQDGYRYYNDDITVMDFYGSNILKDASGGIHLIDPIISLRRNAADIIDDYITKGNAINFSKRGAVAGLDNYTTSDVKNIARDYITERMSEVSSDEFDLVDMKVIGSRADGNARQDSDLDVLVEYRGTMKEDAAFNILHDAENALQIEGIDVDINPIRTQETGTIRTWERRQQRWREEERDNRRLLERAQEANKQPGKEYPIDIDDAEVMFSLSKNNRKTIETWLGKRKDIDDDQRKAVVDYLETLENPKLQLATARWFARGVVRLPEDMSKIEQAVSVAGKAKVDPLQYDSPMALLDAHANFEASEKRINPDEVSTLHKAQEFPAYGITVYDVDEGEESRQNMRQIINTHFGKEASPWCLLQGDGNGNLTEDSEYYWNNYNAYPKQVAFKDGKLLAFSANDSEERCWWDRQDSPHEGLPIMAKMPDDSLGRSAIYSLREDGTLSQPEAIFKGNKQNGEYWEWYELKPDQLRFKETYKDGYLNGPREAYFADGTLYQRGTMKDGHWVGELIQYRASTAETTRFHYDSEGELDGVSERYNNLGQLIWQKGYSHGFWDGEDISYYGNGQMKSRTVFDHNTEIESQSWYRNGQLQEETNYKNGKRDGYHRKWYINGQLSFEVPYKDDLIEGVSRHWAENGQLIHESEQHRGIRNGVEKDYGIDGILMSEDHYVQNLRNGASRFWQSDGKPVHLTEFKDGVVNGISLNYNNFGQPSTIEHYTDGKLNGLYKSFRNGQLESLALFENNEKTRDFLAEGMSEEEAEEKFGNTSALERAAKLAYGKDWADELMKNPTVESGLQFSKKDVSLSDGQTSTESQGNASLSDEAQGGAADRVQLGGNESDGKRSSFDYWAKRYNIRKAADGKQTLSFADLQRLFRDLRPDARTAAIFDRVVALAERAEANTAADNIQLYFERPDNPNEAGATSFAGEIRFNPANLTDPSYRQGKAADTIAHELVHRFTMSTVEAYRKGGKAADALTEEQKAAAKELIDIYKEAKQRFKHLESSDSSRYKTAYDEYNYRFKNPHEFLAGIANTDFRTMLIGIDNGTKNLWERIKDAFKRMLGIDATAGSVYEELSNTLDNLLDNYSIDTFEAMKDTEEILPDVLFSKANENNEIFVSNAQMAVRAIPMGKATPEQWLKMIEGKGGMKAGEDKWLGLSDWLKASDKKTITKEEIEDYINENRIQIEEDHYASDPAAAEAAMQPYVEEFNELVAHPEAAYDAADERVAEFYEEMRAKYGDDYLDKLNETEFAIEGNLLNWREEAANKDPYESAFDQMVEKYGDDFGQAFYLNGERLDYDGDMEGNPSEAARWFLDIEDKPIDSTRLTYTTDGLTNKREIALTVPTIEPWNQSDQIHFGDAGEGRAVAWARFGDAQEDNKKVLFIDEIQSKRHQEGREHGYYDSRLDDADSPDLWAMMQKYGVSVPANLRSEILKKVDDASDTAHRLSNEFSQTYPKWTTKEEYEINGFQNFRLIADASVVGQDKADEYNNAMKASREGIDDVNELDRMERQARWRNSKVPAAPFEKNWHELAMKRMLRYAAENGYDVVAWTTGDQQAERYNIGNVVEDIDKRDGKVYIDLKDGSAITLTVDKSTGEIKESTGAHIESGEYNGKNLRDLIGKELEKKVLEAEDGTTFRGMDLRIGGEGMRGFYDDMLPRFMNKYGKKWGVSTRDAFLTLNDGTHLEAHAVDVNDAMKESVMEGQVMFSKSARAVEEVREKGIGGVVGEDNVAEYYNDVYKSMDAEVRRGIAERSVGNGLNTRKAVEDHLSELAYRGYENDESGALLMAESILDYYAGEKLEPNAVRYMLWRGENKVNEDDLLEVAQDMAMRRSLKIGAYEEPVQFSKSALEDELVAAAANAESTVDEAKEQKDRNIDDMKRGKTLNTFRAMMQQKTYDQKTVAALADLAKQIVKEQGISDINRREIARLMGIVKASVGKSPKMVKRYADAILDLAIDNMLRSEKEALKKLTTIRGSKVNAAGVEVQGELDLQGQKIMKAFNEGKSYDVGQPDDDETTNTLYGLRARLAERLESKDDAVRKEAEAEDAGLALAIDYKENIADLQNEEKWHKDELDKLKDDYKNGKCSKSYYEENTRAIEESMLSSRISQVEAYRDFRNKMKMVLGESIEGRKGFIDREMDHKAEIQHMANSDLQGVSADYDKQPTFLDKLANSSVVGFFTAPLATFDQMLRMIGRKSVDGRGYLWNWFMRKWQESTENAYVGVRDARDKLDAKVSAVFGKDMRWVDLFNEERKMGYATIKWRSADGEMVEHKLNQGQLLYIYMVNKMSDGRMKLRKMGISEADVEAIREQMDERFIKLADWLQEDFLVGLRNKYNAVHERMFGASMAAIEDYFPLVINKGDINKKEDNAAVDYEAMPSTTTGSIIKRRRNNKALDLLNADAFAVVLNHIDQMENWAAFAEFNKDISTLRSYKTFRNKLQNMTTVYGSGKNLWKKFTAVCEIAGGSYKPSAKSSVADTAAVNLAKGFTSSAINFRPYTALKQLLSMPAFIADANPIYLAKNIANPVGAWKWAMENLPIFEKRWMSRIAGDTRLMSTDMDWRVFRSQLYNQLSKIGMTPNAFIDALTVSIGAHSMYQTKYDGYIKDGYTEEQADKKAKQDATTLYNETQQSSEGAFVSPLQLDRTWLSTALSVFRNSSMGYQRQMHDALRNIGRLLTRGYKESSVAFMTKQMVRDGLSEEQAQNAAERRYNKALAHNALRVATFGFLVEFAWDLGPSLVYLLIGDDDDKKKKILEDAAIQAALGGMVEGLSGGNVISEVMNMKAKGETLNNYNPTLMPAISDAKRLIQVWNNDKVAAANDLINLAIKMNFGINPQVLTDMVVAVADACNGDLGVAKEAMLLTMRVMQVPQSQLDQLYIDELGMTAGEAQKMSPQAMAKRYANYRLNRNTPLTGWAYSEEERAKKIKSGEKRFNKLVKERTELHKNK